MLTATKVYNMHVIQSKITKTNPKKFQAEGRAPDAPILDPPLLITVLPSSLQTLQSKL